MTRSKNGLDWDDEDLTTRVFDRAIDEGPIPFEDSALLELDFDAENTSRITQEQLEMLRAKTAEEEAEAQIDVVVTGTIRLDAAETLKAQNILAKEARSSFAWEYHHELNRWLTKRRLTFAVLAALGLFAVLASRGSDEPQVAAKRKLATSVHAARPQPKAAARVGGIALPSLGASEVPDSFLFHRPELQCKP